MVTILVDIRCGGKKKCFSIGKFGLFSVSFGPMFDQNCSFSYIWYVRIIPFFWLNSHFGTMVFMTWDKPYFGMLVLQGNMKK